MHRAHVANVKFAATLWLSALMFCGLAYAQTPSNLFQRIPVSFEENRGQFAEDSRFLIHATNARINMKATQLEIYRTPKLPDTKAKQLNNEPHVAAPPVVMSFVNANSKAVAAPSEESSRKSYYIFNDGGEMPKVITARHFRSVRVANLYPGIDAVYYDKAGEVEYDLIVQPNADPKQVRLHFGGAATAIDANGNINIGAEGEAVIHRSPVVFQGEAKSKSNVASRYVRNGDGTFGIQLGKHDVSKVLTIDPVISFASYLANDDGSAINDLTTDTVGRLVVVGQTSALNFPIRNNLMPNTPTAAPGSFNLGFISRLNRSGTDIEFSTFVAASSTNFVRLDDSGNIFVAAQANEQTGTVSASLNAYKPTGSGAYVLKLSLNGDAVLGATYLGDTSRVIGFAVGANGALAISGSVGASGSIATTAGVWFPTSTGSAFLAKLQPTLSAADFVTHTPESGPVAIDSAGNVYIAGGTASASYPVTAGAFQTVKKDNLDVFVTKLSPSGSLLLSTFIGSNKSTACSTGDDWATSIALGADGGIYLAGRTMSGGSQSVDDPFTASRYFEWNGINPNASFTGSDDSRAFLLKLSPTFASLTFSGSIVTTKIYHQPANPATQEGCLSNFGGTPATVALDKNQNAYLLAGHIGNLFPVTDKLAEYGHTVLVVNSSGQRIAGTKLTTRASIYSVNPATGAIYFVSNDGIQPFTNAVGSSGPLLMKIVSPLARRMTLTGDVNPSTLGQAISLTATTTGLPAGGIFVLRRNGIEMSRLPATSATATFTVSDLQVGFYAFTATYELPDLGGTVTSKTLAQTVTQTAVCP